MSLTMGVVIFKLSRDEETGGIIWYLNHRRGCLGVINLLRLLCGRGH